VGYLAGVRTMFRNSLLARTAVQVEETTPGGAAGESAATREASLRAAVLGFVRAAAAILVTAPLFALCAESLAEVTGLAASFVGTLVVSAATTLPELVTSLAAVRLRAYDLAVGNLFGSNALNLALFAILDLVHPGASIFVTIGAVHALSAMLAIVLMGIALAAIVYRAEGRLRALEPSSALMIGVWLAGMWLVYAFSLRLT